MLTPYPNTLIWYQMGKANGIVSYDWDKYDESHIVYRPQGMTTEQLHEGHMHAYRRFYSLRSMARRFPLRGSRSRTQWSIYSLFYQKGEVTGRTLKEAIAAPTAGPGHVPNPRILPVEREWREAVLEGLRESQSAQSIWDLRGPLVTRRLDAGIDPRGRFGSGRRGHRERQDATQARRLHAAHSPPWYTSAIISGQIIASMVVRADRLGTVMFDGSPGSGAEPLCLLRDAARRASRTAEFLAKAEWDAVPAHKRLIFAIGATASGQPT